MKPSLAKRVTPYDLAAWALTAVILFAAFKFAPTSGKPSIPTWALATHLVTALIALPLGAWILYFPKGTPRHKLLGKIWVVAMLITAFASGFIQSWGRFSFIHIFTVWTPISIIMAIYYIRKGEVKKHQDYMRGTYIGLVIAGVLAVALPGRFLWRLVIG
jgi:uncharacterized membrane protein